MEPVTHFLTGACLGRSGFNRKTAYATLAMTLAAEAPDIDVIASFGGPVSGFCHHRGITHTFLGAPFMALAVTGVVWCVAALSRRGGKDTGATPAQPVRWGWIWLLALLADLSHLLLDFTNNYGLRPFFPFDAHWYAWSIVFIFEPVLFAALVLGLVMPALFGLVDGEMRRRRKGELRGRGWAIAALVCVALLYAVRGTEHARAVQLLLRTGSTTHQPLTRVEAEPVMVNPFSWRGLAETADDYQFSTVHSLGSPDAAVEPGDRVAKPRVTPAVSAAKASYLGRVYGNWSSWPLTEDLGAVAPPFADANDPAALPPGAHTVLFRDMRFTAQSLGMAGRMAGPAGAPPLSGFVVVDASGRVVSEWMNGKRQP